MLSLNKKILVSGCGFSYSKQTRRTWVTVLKATGATIVDVGGPAVSNQWILNKAFLKLLDEEFDEVVIQLTSLGKLDVEVDSIRDLALVKSDSLRNFTINGVWPSSHSREHVSKALYYDYLNSPNLEMEDLFCKVTMLANWCKTHGQQLTILQAYPIPWTEQQQSQLEIFNLTPLYQKYTESELYKLHDFENSNAVPNIHYQLDLAKTLATHLELPIIDRIEKIEYFYKNNM